MSIRIKRNGFDLEISTKTGGAILHLFYKGKSLLQAARCNEKNFDIVKTANFPMLPLGNRIEGNSFVYKGETYTLFPNTKSDIHYLHGDAWLLPWTITRDTNQKIIMELSHSCKEGEPFGYHARQTISILENEVNIHTSIENTGDKEMPFGMGQHFFFPLTEKTTLQANHTEFWTEKEHFLPDKLCFPPQYLDFNIAQSLPKQWINNGYEGWNSLAEIVWPEYNMGVKISADNIFRRFFLFRSCIDFESNFQEDYFCFEPMTHTANAHNLKGDWGLVNLKCGEILEGSIMITPFNCSY